MSLRLGFSVNSLTLGGGGGVAGVVGGVEGGVTVLGGVGGTVGGVVGGDIGGVTGAVGGGGATSARIVAGRFGHPTRKRARTSRGATRNTLPRRCDMFLDPPSLTTVYLALEPPPIRARLSRQSYHGRRGDQEALVVSP